MFRMPRVVVLSIPVLLMALVSPLNLIPQSRGSRALITRPINENVLHRLNGNTRAEANAENDAGPVADSLAMDHMLLQLERPPEQELAVEHLIDSQHDPASPNFHHWLTPAEFGQSFGPAVEDIGAVTGWLESHGFQVNAVYPNGMLIDFSGTAGQVREAFHTSIHALNVNGRQHIANMSDPQIPAALAPAVAGVLSLHDFLPRTMNRPRKDYTFTYQGSAYQALTPADLAAIYNLNPLFAAGTAGQGQTIAVVEDSNLYSNTDWTTFRSTFGLAAYNTGSLTTVHPAPATGANNCTNPGVANGDDGEATLDAEWASAAAPGAAIVVATCASTRTTFGGLLAIENLLNGAAAPPAIISLSYGECEAENGASANAAYNKAFQQAVAEGVSVFVAAGDEGAASCDAGATGATHGIGVSGFASTPYNVAVGGTDFGDTVAGSVGVYWNSTNSATYGSAKSYVPPSRTFRRSRGTTPARVRCWPVPMDLPPASAPTVSVAARSPPRTVCRWWRAEAAVPVAAPADRRRRQGWWAEPARVMPSPSGKRACWACLRTEFAICRTCRCSPAMAYGITSTRCAGPTSAQAARRARALPAAGQAEGEHRSLRPSWPAFRRW